LGDDRKAERTVERDADNDADAVAAGGGAAADSFLELEGELDAADDGTAQTKGLVVDAGTVPAGSVPDAHPHDVESGQALQLTLELADDRTVPAYFGWPDGGAVDPESRLGRLLGALEVSADSFADLYGRTLPLERTGGGYAVFVPPEQPRGTGEWSLGVAGGLGFNLAFFGLAALGAAGLPLGGLPSALAIPFLLVNLLIMPYATYRDGTYLRSHSDWGQGPLFWAALSMVPGLNVLVSGLYLRSRARARFLGEEPSLSTRLVRRVRGLL
jgi:hypothetical protein